jgi:putative ABC transport system permease protein
MYWIDISRRSARSLLSAKARTVLTSFAIAVGTFALTLTLGASNGAQKYAKTIVDTNFDPTELIVTKDPKAFGTSDASKPQVYNSSFGNVTTAAGASEQVQMLSDSDLTQLAKVPGVSSVSPAIDLSLQYITRDGQKMYVATMETYNSYQQPALLAGSIPDTIPNGSLILPQGFLSALGFPTAQAAIGQTVRIAIKQQLDASAVLSALASGNTSALAAQQTNSTPTEQKFTIVAVTKTPSTLIQPGSQLYLYANSSDVTHLNDIATQGTSSYHKYLSAYVKVRNGTNTAVLDTVQTTIKQAGYGAQSVQDTEKFITQIISVLQGIVSVFGLIAIIASVFGVVNTMYISVLQRTREIGLMKALGMHKKDVTRLFRLEAAFIGLLGGLLGALLAVLAGTLLNPVISKQLSLGSQHLLDFKFGQIIILIAILMIIATIAGLLPARKAAKLDPIEALRTE